MSGPDLQIFGTPEEGARLCSVYIIDKLSAALQSGSQASLALSGGSTPKLLFSEMAKAKLDWSAVHVFWVDERCVPPNDPQSNYKLANELLLAPAGVLASNVHRIPGELPPSQGAARYIADIRAFFSLSEGELPAFDVLHRGMGADSHTASLFPGEPLISNRTGIAAAVWVEKTNMNRVTLLPGVLLAAKHTVLQVAGADKADALRDVLKGPEDFSAHPCQIASRDANAVWFLDQAAAAKL